MNILVIGNGFDLAHNLPTRYVDFLDYVKSFKNFNSSNAIDNDDCQKYFSSLKINSPKIYNELENLVSQNYWLDYFDELYIKMKNEYKDSHIPIAKDVITEKNMWD